MQAEPYELREMLAFAAKAAGVKLIWSNDGKYAFLTEPWDGQNNCDDAWCPHFDAGDALRLAVKLKMVVRIFDHISDAQPLSHGDVCTTEMNNGDPYIAACLAITRAAAKIGALMP